MHTLFVRKQEDELDTMIEQLLAPDNSEFLRDELVLVSFFEELQVWWEISGLNCVLRFVKGINELKNIVLLPHGTTRAMAMELDSREMSIRVLARYQAENSPK